MGPLADEESPTPTGRVSSDHLQPYDPAIELIDGLDDFEDQQPARELQRLVEQEIVLDLQLQGFDTTTPEWKVFASALAEYGYSVFKGWFISGVVYSIAARHAGGRGVFGLGKLPEGLRLPPDDAHALAVEVVIRAIDVFRTRTLMSRDPDRRWRPAGGASIKTYFVGRCLMELPDIYQRWKRKERRFATQGARYAALLQDEQSGLGVATESAAGTSASLEEIREHVDPTTMAMFELQVAGYSYEEIADMLTSAGVAMTKAQVRSRMSRARATARSGQ